MRRLFAQLSLITILLGLPMAASAANVTLSGRVYNAATGVGYAGVVITLCNGATATTNAAGNWTASVASGAAYCARLGAGAPAGTPTTRNNPEVGAQPSYENQLAGRNCYHDAGCGATYAAWDRIYDSGLDFVFGVTPSPTTAPAAPTATPTLAPSTTPPPSASPSPTPSATPLAAPASSPTATPTSSPVSQASQPSWLPRVSSNTLINWGIVIGTAVLVLLMLALWPIRRYQRQRYQDYLRSKYYNL